MTAPGSEVFDTAKLRSTARMAALEHPDALVLELECDALAAADALDQARQMLADAEQKIASMELDASLREEDERFADPL